MSLLSELDWEAVRDHYNLRFETHEDLRLRHKRSQFDDFARLALGIEDAAGNYSAAEHGLGPKILAENDDAEEAVHRLASALLDAPRATAVPGAIKAARIRYLSIGVGSELSCMMAPERFWVSNARTIWTHLVFKHDEDYRKANEELKLYREADATSEMAYQIWAAIHREVGPAMVRLAERTAPMARAEGIEPGPLPYLWSDSVAAFLYNARER